MRLKATGLNASKIVTFYQLKWKKRMNNLLNTLLISNINQLKIATISRLSFISLQMNLLKTKLWLKHSISKKLPTTILTNLKALKFNGRRIRTLLRNLWKKLKKIKNPELKELFRKKSMMKVSLISSKLLNSMMKKNIWKILKMKKEELNSKESTSITI